jgi:signal transduction histidine kinase
VLERAIGLATQPLKRQHIQLTTDLQSTPTLQLAVEQLTQAIFNVLLNAGEAAGERGQIHIVTRAEVDHVMVMIVDDGPAIKPEVLTHVGEPFFTTKTGRTGLGLAVSHTVVQQHGGTLVVENLTNERGVVVTIKLPCVKT